jgi:hypothetical protein
LLVRLRQRLEGINTNLDDLQSGVDAGSREAVRICEAATGIDRLKRRDGDVVGTIVRHAKELQACMRDQRAALRELRDSLAGLRVEVIEWTGTERPPPESAADRRVGDRRSRSFRPEK